MKDAQIPMTRTRVARLIEENPATAYSLATSTEWGFGMVRLIPDHMQAGMARHVLLGVRPGSFLSAVIDNDLMQAARKADDTNRLRLFDYAAFLVNYAPSDCFGSYDNAFEWLKRGGLLGRPAEGDEQC